MKEDIAKYSSKIATLTFHLMNNVISKIWNDDSINKEPHKYLYTVLFKTNNALDTSNILTLNIIDKPTTTDSLFLILRTAISDLVIYEYLLRISKSDEDFENNIHRMYYDHIENTIKEMRKFYGNAYKESESKINEKIDELKSMNPNYFKEDGQPKFIPLKLSVSSMARKIISNKAENENLEYLITAKELYDRFSKYEHFGILTLDLIHRQFKEERLIEVFQDIFWANKVILFYVDNIIGIWLKKEDEEYKIFDDLRREIADLKWMKK
jgi:hypothetical protein